jgi:quercetin dioxygenase-like cupin family protein
MHYGPNRRVYTPAMNKTFIATCSFTMLATSLLVAQAVGGREKGQPVVGDAGMAYMVVMDRPDFRVLRDWADPGAVRRMHNHPDATYHVFTLVTGQLRMTIEGQAPFDVNQGDVLELKGGVMHGFTNTGKVTATLVEVFGKARP